MTAVRVRTPGNLPETRIVCDWTSKQGEGCRTLPVVSWDAMASRKLARKHGWVRVDGKDYCPSHVCPHGYVPGDHHYESGSCAPGAGWFRDSYGVISNGIGWGIVRDVEDFDPDRPWSLWHHGEFVGNHETVQAAKADVDFSDCSKCRTREDGPRDWHT